MIFSFACTAIIDIVANKAYLHLFNCHFQYTTQAFSMIHYDHKATSITYKGILYTASYNADFIFQHRSFFYSPDNDQYCCYHPKQGTKPTGTLENKWNKVKTNKHETQMSLKVVIW